MRITTALTTNFFLEEQARRLSLKLVGIYNKDTLPYIPSSGFYIVNLQDDFINGVDVGGTHWVGMYIENRQACYFDPFGFQPPIEVQYFLKDFVPYSYSDKQIQNISSGVCGYYVLYWMYFMQNNGHILSLKKRMERFLCLWSSDVKKNRMILEKHLERL